jgi:phosphoglycolate phosphatase
MIIYLDLAGPVLDVSTRYWHVYRDVLAQLGKSALPLAEYWALKRARTPVADILRRTGADDVLDVYTRMRIARIETRRYLEYDRVSPGARDALAALGREHRLVVVTLRRSAEALDGELERLELTPLFDRVLSSDEQRTPRWRVKVELIRSGDGYQAGKVGMIVGDTETDIMAGKELGLRTVGVLSGIRVRERLEAVEPDVLLSSIVELVPLLEVSRENTLRRGWSC